METANILEMSDVNIEAMEKDQLITHVKSLRNEVKILNDDFKKLMNFRLYLVERNQFIGQQYSRRDTIEISGIPDNIDDKHLEDEVLEIMKETKVTVNSQHPKNTDIQATHRLKNGKTTIVKMLNRKFATAALINGEKNKLKTETINT